jgi:hypothetical protein
MDLDARLQDAVQHFWNARARQKKKQEDSGRIDAGTRGAVTGGTQMGAFEVLATDILVGAGLDQLDIKSRTALELPGYYRPEKKWDLIVISRGQLVAVIEFKSQVGPSFGNNFNNRTEEAIGSASDLWVAYREGRFGTTPAPFLGYLFVLEDCPEVKKPVRNAEPFFKVDPEFRLSSYSRRYELFQRRLVLERLYTAGCLILATHATPTVITQPAEDLTFRRFAAALQGHATTFLGGQP